LSVADWAGFALHLSLLSFLAVGGAMAVAPDLHRYLVVQQGWLGDPEFAASIALAQAAPGPNVLFIALLGWNVGLQSGGHVQAVLGLLLALVGMLLPSSLLTLSVTRWAQRHHRDRSVRAFKLGMAPLVIGLLLATAWILAAAQAGPRGWAPPAAVSALVMVLVWKTRLHLLWMLGAGAVAGAMGWI
jgi:chromate transporter